MAADDESGSNAAVVTARAAKLGLLASGGHLAIAAPVHGAVYAHYFVHGMDELSDQSDDEDAVTIKC